MPKTSVAEISTQQIQSIKRRSPRNTQRPATYSEDWSPSDVDDVADSPQKTTSDSKSALADIRSSDDILNQSLVSAGIIPEESGIVGGRDSAKISSSTPSDTGTASDLDILASVCEGVASGSAKMNPEATEERDTVFQAPDVNKDPPDTGQYKEPYSGTSEAPYVNTTPQKRKMMSTHMTDSPDKIKRMDHPQNDYMRGEQHKTTSAPPTIKRNLFEDVKDPNIAYVSFNQSYSSTQNNPLACPSCHVVFDDITQLVTHVQTQHVSPAYPSANTQGPHYSQQQPHTHPQLKRSSSAGVNRSIPSARKNTTLSLTEEDSLDFTLSRTADCVFSPLKPSNIGESPAKGLGGAALKPGGENLNNFNYPGNKPPMTDFSAYNKNLANMANITTPQKSNPLQTPSVNGDGMLGNVIGSIMQISEKNYDTEVEEKKIFPPSLSTNNNISPGSNFSAKNGVGNFASLSSIDQGLGYGYGQSYPSGNTRYDFNSSGSSSDMSPNKSVPNLGMPGSKTMGLSPDEVKNIAITNVVTLAGSHSHLSGGGSELNISGGGLPISHPNQFSPRGIPASSTTQQFGGGLQPPNTTQFGGVLPPPNTTQFGGGLPSANTTQLFGGGLPAATTNQHFVPGGGLQQHSPGFSGGFSTQQYQYPANNAGQVSQIAYNPAATNMPQPSSGFSSNAMPNSSSVFQPVTTREKLQQPQPYGFDPYVRSGNSNFTGMSSQSRPAANPSYPGSSYASSTGAQQFRPSSTYTIQPPPAQMGPNPMGMNTVGQNIPQKQQIQQSQQYGMTSSSYSNSSHSAGYNSSGLTAANILPVSNSNSVYSAGISSSNSAALQQQGQQSAFSANIRPAAGSNLISLPNDHMLQRINPYPPHSQKIPGMMNSATVGSHNNGGTQMRLHITTTTNTYTTSGPHINKQGAYVIEPVGPLPPIPPITSSNRPELSANASHNNLQLNIPAQSTNPVSMSAPKPKPELLNVDINKQDGVYVIEPTGNIPTGNINDSSSSAHRGNPHGNSLSSQPAAALGISTATTGARYVANQNPPGAPQLINRQMVIQPTVTNSVTTGYHSGNTHTTRRRNPRCDTFIDLSDDNPQSSPVVVSNHGNSSPLATSSHSNTGSLSSTQGLLQTTSSQQSVTTTTASCLVTTNSYVNSTIATSVPAGSQGQQASTSSLQTGLSSDSGLLDDATGLLLGSTSNASPSSDQPANGQMQAESSLSGETGTSGILGNPSHMGIPDSQDIPSVGGIPGDNSTVTRPEITQSSSGTNPTPPGAIVLYSRTVNTIDHTSTLICNKVITKTEKFDDGGESPIPAEMRENIFVVCTNCGTNSAKYDVCEFCRKPLPYSARLYEPDVRPRCSSASEIDKKIVGLRQTRNLSDSTKDGVAMLSSGTEAGVVKDTADDGQEKEVTREDGNPENGDQADAIEPPVSTSSPISHLQPGPEAPAALDSQALSTQAAENTHLPATDGAEKEEDGSKPEETQEVESPSSARRGHALEIARRHDLNTLVVDLPMRRLLIGTYNALPADVFQLTTKGVQLTFEQAMLYMTEGEGSGLRIHIGSHDITRINVFLGKSNPLMFLETTSVCSQKIRHALEMTPGKEPYFDCHSPEPMHHHITLVFKELGNFGIEDYIVAICKAIEEDHPLRSQEGEEGGTPLFQEIDAETAQALLPSTVYPPCESPLIAGDPSTTGDMSLGCSDHNTSLTGDSTAGGAEDSDAGAICVDEDEDQDVMVVAEKKFKKDLAFLKPNQVRLKPRLLEIQSNCDWTAIRGRITGIMGRVLGNNKRYPAEKNMRVDAFNVEILPKPKQQTRVPQNLVKKFDGFFVYPISVRITEAVEPENCPAGNVGSSAGSRSKDVIDLTARRKERRQSGNTNSSNSSHPGHQGGGDNRGFTRPVSREQRSGSTSANHSQAHSQRRKSSVSDVIEIN